MGGPLSLFRMHWDHEPDNAVGARLCEPQRVATAPSPAGHRPALRDGRFMESPPVQIVQPTHGRDARGTTHQSNHSSASSNAGTGMLIILSFPMARCRQPGLM